jgi:ElaB/YqjD/DUF883 family membrane-anchored ribosome-binding protein
MAGKGDSGHPRMTAGYPTSTSEQSEEQKGLKDKAQEMASNLGETAGQMREKAQEFVSGVASQAGESWRSTREGVQERFSRMSHQAEDLWGDVNTLVHRYPVASLTIAFGVGFLASCAMSSLSSRPDDVAERMSRSSA